MIGTREGPTSVPCSEAMTGETDDEDVLTQKIFFTAYYVLRRRNAR